MSIDQELSLLPNKIYKLQTKVDNMCISEFLSKSLTPEIFWIAVAAIGTMLAVFIALFSSSISTWKYNRRITGLIEVELRENLEIITDMISTESRILFGGHNISAIEISAIENNDECCKHIKLNLWKEFRYKLAASNPSKYQIYRKINLYAEAIVNTANDEPAIRLALQTDAANNFVENYKQVFVSIDT